MRHLGHARRPQRPGYHPRNQGRETGIDIEIIAGSEEARIVYNNHIETATAHRDGTHLYVDVEEEAPNSIIFDNGMLVASGSFNIGTVRILTGKVRPRRMGCALRFIEENVVHTVKISP